MIPRCIALLIPAHMVRCDASHLKAAVVDECGGWGACNLVAAHGALGALSHFTDGRSKLQRTVRLGHDPSACLCLIDPTG
jgi:hypothetical protein